MSEKELVAKCRLGTCVKKTILISFFDENSNFDNHKTEKRVKFKSLKWTASIIATESNILENEQSTTTTSTYSEKSSIKETACDTGTISPKEILHEISSCQSSITEKSGEIKDVLDELRSPEFWKPFQ